MKATSNINWFAVAAGVVSIGSVVMVLLGYGVSLAVETTFGLPHAAVFDSTFELMDLASIALLELIPSVVHTLEDGSLLTGLYKAFGPVVEIMAGLFLVLALVGWFFEPPRRSADKRPASTPQARLHWGMSAKRYIWGNALLGLGILLYPLLSLLGVIAILLIATVLAIVPMIGMSAGNAYISKWVVAPEKCRSAIALDAMRDTSRPKPPIAAKSGRSVNCVALKKDQELVASGRVVFYTSKAVVLVDESGQAKRVPTDGLVVEVTDALP